MGDMVEAEKFLDNVLLADKSNEEQIKLYTEIAYKYDEELETFHLRRDSNILDVGAGTGALGKVLHSLYYTNIDALDACENMLQNSRKLTHVYKNFIHAKVVIDEVLPIAENTY
ncbi:malonyl-[acyl-carrier protein] O-methyltransferase-like protein, partial [Leptotrombidium deliense]